MKVHHQFATHRFYLVAVEKLQEKNLKVSPGNKLGYGHGTARIFILGIKHYSVAYFDCVTTLEVL